MRVLAIDSSGLTATVAVVEETQTVAEYTINYKKTHSQTLLPMIDEVVKMTELDLGTINAIAVAGGPGLNVSPFGNTVEIKRKIVIPIKLSFASL